ncbi:FapA family protein [Treponema phagedenis]|uniref:DUF342 domain-containing protein n=1 Tax=Treponema phagedenis TaxID=162 RepID=A0AAE6M820_TREPH|nr:FapA family protein [Treponema phagedenis]QEJ99421.1 DUF342 domain-containing protein [Treponema phagedenis]QEJ99798.1 DUF342 domain-containing protein [Treponema phagedenis]QEK04992.1 DUF342 domain-containing protein [Treponema phagedenis]QEK07273.1 DUF342 domain-containing protein [Treponema phagedenis]QEK10613.1 DUF342 domain-containing protein [Treponema phagedenis]
MISLNQIYERMREQYEEDAARVFEDVSGKTLDEAIDNAAVQLQIPRNRIGYEILERGASGFFVLTPREWKIRAYEVKRTKPKVKSEEIVAGAQSEEKEVSIDKDGMAYVYCSAEGVFLKVVKPVGKGKKATLFDVVEKIRDRNVPVPSEDILNQIVKDATGEYVHIAPFERVPGNDAMMSVMISENEMKAFLVVTPPGHGGADVSADMIISFLKTNNVVYGINEQRAQEFQDSPIYRENYLIAEGLPPKNGENAKMLYNFETDNTRVRLQETKSGQINFKELNLIQNVVEGQPLAQKIPAERGVAGKTVTGKYLEATSGEDIPIPLGKHTKLAEDGLTVIAEINGQVLLVKGKINVEPIYVVEGNVSIKTGNIMFLGTVLINGNVEDAYEVKASGNIEIKGTVGKAVLDAEGDILVSQGIIGKDGGSIRAGKSIWSKFIQNTENVEAGDMVIVSDGIINSNVMANHKVICRGRRADIISSKIAASEAIYARNLGSAIGGKDTILSVGFDPRSKERLTFLQEKVVINERSLAEIKLNLQSLENLKKIRKELPKDKQELEVKMNENKYLLETEIKEASSEINQIKNYLDSLRTDGKISASGNVYAGVKIVIKDIAEDVRADCKATTFYLENGLVRYGKYQNDEDEDFKKVPSGYSAY